MPLYMPDKSKCPLCHEVLRRGQPLVGFTSFLKQTNTLALMSDAVGHKECFERWEHRDLFLHLFKRFEAIWDARPLHLHWREGEEWLRIQGEELDREAELLDPGKK